MGGGHVSLSAPQNEQTQSEITSHYKSILLKI